MTAAKTSTHTRQMDFNDPNIRGGLTNRPEHYKAVAGRVDRVRLMTLPLTYLSASINPAEADKGRIKGFNAMSLADLDDGLAAINGDAAALERCKAACPIFQRGYDVKQRFVVLMWWISSQQNGRSVKKDQLLPFAFAGDKYAMLRTIMSGLPINPQTKQPRALATIELDLTINSKADEGFQKIQFVPIPGPDGHQSTYKEAKERIQEVMVGDLDPSAAGYLAQECVLLTEFLELETRANLIRSLDRVEGKGGEQDEFANNGAAPAPARPAAAGRPAPARRQAPAPAPAPVEEAPPDDGAEIDDGGLGLEEPEVEAPAPAPVVTRPAPARRQAPAAAPAAAPAKPAAAPRRAPRPAAPAAPEAGGDPDDIFG